MAILGAVVHGAAVSAERPLDATVFEVRCLLAVLVEKPGVTIAAVEVMQFFLACQWGSFSWPPRFRLWAWSGERLRYVCPRSHLMRRSRMQFSECYLQLSPCSRLPPILRLVNGCPCYVSYLFRRDSLPLRRSHPRASRPKTQRLYSHAHKINRLREAHFYARTRRVSTWWLCGCSSMLPSLTPCESPPWKPSVV